MEQQSRFLRKTGTGTFGVGNRKTMTTLQGTHNYVYDKINQLRNMIQNQGK